MYDNTQINFVKCLYLYSNHYFCIQKIIIGMYVGKYLGVSKWRKPFYLNKYFFLLRRIIIERKYRLMKSSSSFQVCLGFYVPLEKVSLIWRRHHDRRRASNVDLCSALMAIEQSGFFSEPHLLWHETSAYNGHLRGPVTLTPNAERFVVELSLTDLTTY